MIFSFACQQKKIKRENYYTNTVDINYNNAKHRLPAGENRFIFMDGVVNDSISVNIFFDTGSIKYDIIISDSLRKVIGNDSILLKIGSFEKNILAKSYPTDNPFFSTFGANTVCIGWSYFRDKTIEISYKDRKIRELSDSTYYSRGYTKIKIDKTKWNELLIPITVYIQDKEITEKVSIDTGSNGSVDFGSQILSKYEINTTGEKKLQV